jgi:hypothetical protein
MTKLSLKSSQGQVHGLKQLNIETRNRVRAILGSDKVSSLALLNKLRQEKSAREITKIETVLRCNTVNKEIVIPELFPKIPQTLESFNRLQSIDLSKQLQIIDVLAEQSSEKLTTFFFLLRTLNDLILKRMLDQSEALLEQMIFDFGHSHLLIRKAVLIKSLGQKEDARPFIDNLLLKAGLETNRVLVTSLIHCYKEEQDFLSLKRSIMQLPKRGLANKFTRDLSRIPFHPIAKNNNDLSELIQSCLQSSLIDAIIIIKVNHHIAYKFSSFIPTLNSLNIQIEKTALGIDAIASMYMLEDSEGEYSFYKQSSAWLESDEVISYRILQDHFYDLPESDYLEIGEYLISRINDWVCPLNLNTLSTSKELTRHSFENLKLLEVSGTVTRSSTFNYYIHISEGFSNLGETALIDLMGKTRDLAKTINPVYLRNLASISDSKLSQLILYLLIAKKSRNERDNHRLRKIFQEIVKSQFDGKIVELFNYLNSRSRSIAEYAYETCTEDFIAQLYHIIETSSEVTETRASLHQWAGKVTGDKVYLDRARTLLIDHQLNKIRNEIDDHRIYVDAARFGEWMNDEVMRELNSVLTSLEHKNNLLDAEDPQLISIIERCYSSFCSNDIFGIASYLGRRIRHGTFKGHLYSSVIGVARLPKYEKLLADPSISIKWQKWKTEYEKTIDTIIRDRLHIESPGKRHGLLRPTQQTTIKQEILLACARKITKDFKESTTTLSAIPTITEFCWILAECDLKNINSFLKGQKAALINHEILTEIKSSARIDQSELTKDFCRDLIRQVDEKLISMYNWFKKPISVSPKASLSLLYKAVVAEVQESFSGFETATQFDELDDIELMGGAYHVVYDSFYVVIYNAAKHGDTNAQIQRNFWIQKDTVTNRKVVVMEITSSIKDTDDESVIQNRLMIKPEDDLSDAQVSEDRSGIRKLYNLQNSHKNFSVKNISCQNRKVKVELLYALEN